MEDSRYKDYYDPNGAKYIKSYIAQAIRDHKTNKQWITGISIQGPLYCPLQSTSL